MRRAFPPGADAGWTKTRPRSFWRESEWLLELIRAAVWPEFKIADCLERWNDIAKDLAERSRRRMPRIGVMLS